MRERKSVGFHAPKDRMVFAPRSEGGVGHDSGSRWGNATFRYLPYSAVVVLCESDPTVPNGRKRGGRERPPQKVGGHADTDSWHLGHASIRPHAGRSRLYLSLREGSEPAPQEGR